MSNKSANNYAAVADTAYHTFRYLADIGYPTGDKSLAPHRDKVYAWLRELETAYDGPLFIQDKYRVHGSFHGNALHWSILLESKFIDGEGWQVERKTPEQTHNFWNEARLGKANIFLTVDALEILKLAGRL
jgi:hypothetical protein